MKQNAELLESTTQEQDVNPAKSDRKASWEHVKSLFEGISLDDEDVARSRDERLG
ncbi:MAG: hypothetical protein LUF29_00680 [Oscillospiraceae bacterium]|nr:hypothetical protein [Oscillospiraceae bacterium]